MNILALDTSTEYCSVALLHDGNLTFREEHAGQRHSELLLPMIEALLSASKTELTRLHGIAFGAGPGSFTGLRIACGVVQGLAFGAGLAVVPVGTLLALAEATGAPKVVACLDARMGEIYHAAYRRNEAGWIEAAAPSVCKADAAPALDGTGWVGCGSGFSVYGEVLAVRYHGQLAQVLSQAFPRAREVAKLALPELAAGHGVPAEQAVPLYVRDKVARKMHELT
ncbi:MAG TPA: tRNA (adenosine(37)-N6)-threonylcarbamoyltransferase complex dimerization subunit type 1 TsaB [Burkholderiales bacterium]|nr:tRNA (adenosine(37)-N6)-threonylcarbamoyltransferase complex dimerization subunit type 1 TsaB [Burkholderiales bacterium]